jgi:hypothetical protein
MNRLFNLGTAKFSIGQPLEMRIAGLSASSKEALCT